jgi:ankyrin repeat protein
MKRPTTGETAVHIAMKKKDLDMLRLLIENGGNIDSQNVRIVFKFIGSTHI